MKKEIERRKMVALKGRILKCRKRMKSWRKMVAVKLERMNERIERWKVVEMEKKMVALKDRKMMRSWSKDGFVGYVKEKDRNSEDGMCGRIVYTQRG